jgi:hypothetical protein
MDDDFLAQQDPVVVASNLLKVNKPFFQFRHDEADLVHVRSQHDRWPRFRAGALFEGNDIAEGIHAHLVGVLLEHLLDDVAYVVFIARDPAGL